MKIDDVVKSMGVSEDMGFNDAEVMGGEVESVKAGLHIDLGILKAQTGEGEIEEYINHPLNINKSKSLAHVIRGLTGMFGSLKYAIIDIVMGIIQYLKEKKGGV